MKEPRNRGCSTQALRRSPRVGSRRFPLPTAGQGEVRVRVLASSVEYTDVVIRRQLYPWVFRRLPFIIGYDVAGEID